MICGFVFIGFFSVFGSVSSVCRSTKYIDARNYTQVLVWINEADANAVNSLAETTRDLRYTSI